jgi:C4-dicarboxylate transporter DctM subunit
VICNAGTLGILIPPSIVMVVYAAATEVSVGRMFMAGVIPGLAMGLLLMIAIYITARLRNLPAQQFPGWRELAGSAGSAAGGLFLIVIIMGGIYGGIFTPTEAAAVSAVYAFLVAVCGYRDLGPIKNAPWRKDGETLVLATARNAALTFWALLKSPIDADVRRVLIDGARVSIMLLFIIANAMLFAHVLTTERIPHAIAETIIGLGLAPWTFLIVVNVLLLIAGNFMEPSAILLIMAPILFPIAIQLGIDPIHLGIIMVVNMEIGMITPPVGLNLFVTAGITGMPLTEVIKAAAPWLMLLLGFLVLITYVPIVSTFLPTLLLGPETVVQ